MDSLPLSFVRHSRWMCAVMVGSVMLFAAPGEAAPEVSGELAKVRAALPEKARVAPKAPRKVLVFSLAKGYVHASIPLGEKTIQFLGEKTGAFEAVLSRDPESFRPENLHQFDAVIMNSISGEPFTDPELREILRRFVQDEGKGLVGIHGATTAFREWPEYGNMIGAYFNTHPWTAGTTVTLKVEEPDHPLCAAFPERNLTLVEEIYQFHPRPYSRSRLRVLVSLDTERTDMSLKGIDRFDNDFPVSWVQTSGKGRVFYSSLGHNFHIYSNPVILQHFLDGIQFALGDLPAPTEPRPDVAQEILVRALPGRLDAVTGYTWGADRTALTHLDHLVHEATLYPETRARFAREIGARLQKEAAESKSTETLVRGRYLVRKLIELGGDEAVAALAPLLRGEDPLLADAAYLALGEIPGEAAVAALREALSSAPAPYRAGIAGVLGHRRDAKAVAPLTALAGAADTDTLTAQAAILSLGQIGTPEAAQALAKLAQDTPSGLQDTLLEARVTCADRLAEAGNNDEARKAFTALLETAPPGAARAAALMGLAGLGGAESRALVIRALVGDEIDLREAATAFLVQGGDPEADEDIVKALAGAAPDRQAAGLRVLARRPGAASLAWAREMAQAENPEVRLAALEALGTIGDGSVVELLARTAATTRGAEQQAARASLASLPAQDADAAVIGLLKSLGGKSGRDNVRMRQELVTAFEERHVTESVPALLTAAADPDSGVRSRAFKALATLADGSQSEKLVALLLDARPKAVRQEAEKAVVAASRRVADESARAGAVIAALGRTRKPDVVASLVRALGRIGTPEALAVLRERLGSGETNTEVRDALVRAIAEFPSAEAFPEALALARASENQVHQVLALRGAARMLALPGDRPSTETLRLWTELMDLARRPDEQKMILGEVGGTTEPALLSFVVSKLDVPSLKKEAAAAAIRLANATCKTDPEACRVAMEKVLSTADSTDRKKAAAVLKKIEELTKAKK